jgi:signal transduction histidine kinase
MSQTGWFRKLIELLGRIGADPAAPETEALQRRYLVYMGVLMSLGGLIWGGLALGLGLYLESVIPFGYTVITTVNFTFYHRTMAFERARFVQVLISLLLPFCFQWVLGGFHASGDIMLWAMVALFGSLIFSSARDGLVWLGLFIALTVVSAIIDPWVAQLPAARIAAKIQDYAIIANLIVVCSITFGLTIALMSGRQQTTERLEAANAQISKLNAQLSEREANLSRRTHELSQSLEALRSTQRELVRSEKLASLGSLVAGVAHEINTPLGVAVTASSLAREAVEQISEDVDKNQIKRSALVSRLNHAREALAMLETNIQRGASLVRNFKTVSVDQTADTVRTFDLATYLEEILSSLAPLTRKAGISVRIDNVSSPVVTTRAGALSQVITNLVSNAVNHAFDPSAPGELCFTVREETGRAIIVAKDNGVGMSREIAEHVFDPFFTTRGGRGGSGLGLFIVHNLVTEGLGGQVTLETNPGQGAMFTLDFPTDCGCA